MTATVHMIRTCSIWRTLEIIGDLPTLLLMESYWLGARRFDEFCNDTGLLKTVVSDRLKKLIDNECMTKVAYSKRPARYEYKATKQFLEFYPTALAMLYWERKWGLRSGKIMVRLRHRKCGAATRPRPVCKCCREEIDACDVSWKEGPGVGLMKADYSRRRRPSGAGAGVSTPLLDEIAQIIGDRWSTLILRSIFTGLNTFQEILEDTAISTNILSERLVDLCRDSVLKRVGDEADARRAHYRLTNKGRDIYPIILSLLEWGDKWRPSPKGPPLLLTHKSCGKPLELEMACQACGEDVKARDVAFEFAKTPTRRRVAAKTAG